MEPCRDEEGNVNRYWVNDNIWAMISQLDIDPTDEQVNTLVLDLSQVFDEWN